MTTLKMLYAVKPPQDLEDVPEHMRCLAKLGIYYLSKDLNPEFMGIVLEGNVEKERISDTHMVVFAAQLIMPEASREDFLNALYAQFNGPENPLSTPDHQKYIIENRLHTRFSVGDIIQLNFPNDIQEMWVRQKGKWAQL